MSGEDFVRWVTDVVKPRSLKCAANEEAMQKAGQSEGIETKLQKVLELSMEASEMTAVTRATVTLEQQSVVS